MFSKEMKATIKWHNQYDEIAVILNQLQPLMEQLAESAPLATQKTFADGLMNAFDAFALEVCRLGSAYQQN